MWKKDVEVAIVGGGLTGIVTAYLLAKAGKEVIVLEKNKIGSGATGLTTAFLTQIIDTDLSDLIWMFGLEKARLVVESHHSAIAMVEKIVYDEKIDCRFGRCPHIIYTANDQAHLKRECDVAEMLGLEAECRNDKRLGFPNNGYLEVRNQAKFHATKYLRQLVDVCKESGVTIFENTPVNRHISPDQLQTNRGSLRAQWIIFATYAPFDHHPGLYFKKAFYTSYVYQIKLEPGKIPEATYEDTANPYHYFRIDRFGEFDQVIVGGEDHRSDLPVDEEKAYGALRQFVSRIFGHLGYEIMERWRGPIIEPADGLASIGPYERERTLYATGFSGNGMTYAHIAAMIFRDVITGQDNPWAKIYSARRVPAPRALLVKGRDYLGELWHGAVKKWARRSRPYR